MDSRELRIKFAMIVCVILMFGGLAIFFAVVDTKAFIDSAYLPIMYTMIALSGFATVMSVLIAEEVFPIMIVSLFTGCGLLIFGLFRLVPH